MFINLTNHPSANWSDEQMTAARQYGEVVDFPYPPIDAYTTEEDIRKLTEEWLGKILEAKPDAIMVCGEFAFTFQMVDALLKHGINVLMAASGRDTVETYNPDGSSIKTSHYRFHCFRKYEYYHPEGEA